MHRRHLHQRAQRSVRQPFEKMNARKIEMRQRRPQAIRLPVAPIRRGISVGRRFRSDEHDMGPRTPAQYLRQSAHEYMEAAHGLHAPREISDDLVFARECEPARGFEFRGGIGGDPAGIDAFMRNVDLVFEILAEKSTSAMASGKSRDHTRPRQSACWRSLR